MANDEKYAPQPPAPKPAPPPSWADPKPGYTTTNPPTPGYKPDGAKPKGAK